jgi:hypothetical protein
MLRKTEEQEALKGSVRLPSGVTLKPPLTVEDLRLHTEHDPSGAEEFANLVRSVRGEGSRPLSL